MGDRMMESRKERPSNRRSPLRSKAYWTGLIVLAAILCGGVIWFVNQTDTGRQAALSTPASTGQSTANATPTPTPQPAKKVIVDFHMYDLERGWVRYEDGIRTTKDGGATYLAASESELEVFAKESLQLTALQGTGYQPAVAAFGGQSYSVTKAQFLTERIGWALVKDEGALKTNLLLTVDGGATWLAEQMQDAQQALATAQEQAVGKRQEASLYGGAGAAKKAMDAAWTLIPETASPGDVVLVRHAEAGSVKWQGKTYALQPFGGGYFTYLPIAMDVKPGQYPIGDVKLTIKAKKFETQYLTVTKQMESMRQDTDRIQADQKKIDAARSKSQPSFLFTEPFVQPVEGVLTTPFGYTRYVNGKYDSAHRALDLAAKEGTPIQATNDGIVALADSLYLTGNSIYIDHGMNLFSQYAHMSKLLVKTGDRVKKGDIIGLVGTTGFSTGPHLHFTFWAHNVPVNPNLFFDSTPFKWLK